MTGTVGKKSSPDRALILGAALFFGDSMTTPAISVLSSVEDLAVTPASRHPSSLVRS